jgi:hypothetical protein
MEPLGLCSGTEPGPAVEGQGRQHHFHLMLAPGKPDMLPTRDRQDIRPLLHALAGRIDVDFRHLPAVFVLYGAKQASEVGSDTATGFATGTISRVEP